MGIEVKSIDFDTCKILTGNATSPFLLLLLLSPLIFLCFISGVYLGSQFSTHDDQEAAAVAPNNVLQTWKAAAPQGGGLRGSSDVKMEDIPPLMPQVHPISPESIKQVSNPDTVLEPDESRGNVASASSQDLTSSLHVDSFGGFIVPKQTGHDNIIYGAWVYLHDVPQYDIDMRTIFSNKGAGCENTKERKGVAVYVNAWQSSDHRLYAEFAGGGSGCNKIFSNVELQPSRWYHVAVALSSSSVTLYLDGVVIGESRVSYDASDAALIIGQWSEAGGYPLYGNVSHFAIASSFDEKATVELMQRAPLHASADLASLMALYELKPPNSIDVISGKRGVYIKPPSSKRVPGVSIPLVDGLEEGRVVTDEMIAESDATARTRRESIKAGMVHAWQGYKKYAWGRDEVKPLSRGGSDNWGGMGVTLVDSLDTLWLMGLKKEFSEARDWVAQSLTFNNAGVVSVFETTIRELGGLLAAYDLSKDDVFLKKAEDLGHRLLGAFDTPSGIPRGQVSLTSREGVAGWSGGSAILSEIGTLQVEFRYLAEATGNKAFETKSMAPLLQMHKRQPPNGLFPIKVSVADGHFTDTTITFGALGDSFYEYLLKLWLQGGKKETWLREMYDKSVDGAISILLKASSPSGLAFLSDWNGRTNNLKMDHLVCFMAGTLALGAKTDPRGPNSERAMRDLSVARALMYTCREMYHRTATGISPEFVTFKDGSDMITRTSAPFYILRPETAESLFYLHQLTGDPIYREWGWEIWSAIDKHCRTDVAYGALRDVNMVSSGVDNRMESFFLAETLKYLYLLQDPDNEMDLTRVIFNTEAHPLRIKD